MHHLTKVDVLKSTTDGNVLSETQTKASTASAGGERTSVGLKNWTYHSPIHRTYFSVGLQPAIHVSTNNYLWVNCLPFTQPTVRCRVEAN